MIPSENNDKLCDFARYWKLDGDWLTCKGCKRSLIASRDGEPAQHAAGCKNADRQHPWAELRGLIAPTSAAGATKPNELTSSPEPAPALRAAEWVDEAMRLAERIEAAGARRGRDGKAPSDHEPEMHALRAHLSRASGLLPVAREGLTQARIEGISRTLFYSDDDASWGPDTLNAIWVRDIATPLVRAIEAEHGIAPASGDAPGEAK